MGEPNAQVNGVAEEPAEAKQQLANKNGKKAEGGAGGSYFTWFMVLALLGVWTSVAVVWFDLVDYQGVVGKLGSYDADNDGDFDLEDVQVMLDADIESVIPETLENLSEEASGWLYGFFTLVYDIMTPFEVEQEVGVATEDVTAEDQAVVEKVSHEAEKTQEVAVKRAPRVGSIYRDPVSKLKEALKRQLAMIHARIQAKKIARLAMDGARSVVTAEEEERHAQRSTEIKLLKVMKKMEEGGSAKARREERAEEEKKAKRAKAEKKEKAGKDKKVVSKRMEGDDKHGRKTRKKEKHHRGRKEKGQAPGEVGKGG